MRRQVAPAHEGSHLAETAHIAETAYGQDDRNDRTCSRDRAWSRLPAVREGNLRVPAALVRVDLHRALSVDVACRAAAGRVDPGGPTTPHRWEFGRRAAAQGGIRRRHRGAREG